VNQHIDNPPAPDDSGTALVQQLDSAIGQTSSVMGALVHELIRRSLHDGVLQIGQGLQGFAAEKVDDAVAGWKPRLEEATARTARDEALETATEVARQHLDQLSARIDHTARAAEDTSAHFARELNEKFEAAESSSATRDRELQEQIEVAEQRAREEVLAEVGGKIHQWRSRARRSTLAIKDRLASLEATCEDLDRLLKILEQRTSWLREEVAEARTSQEDLEEHVIKLETSGWRGLIRRLCFWKPRDGEGRKAA
jgi:polyribonucleotide nucleotidyltransferase